MNNFFNKQEEENQKIEVPKIKLSNPFLDIEKEEIVIDTKVETTIETTVETKKTVDTTVEISVSKPQIVEKLCDVNYHPVNTLDLVNIHQSYDDGKTVIFDGLDLNIKDIVDEGQFVTILGQSGCGKSTILRYIAGLQRPNSGDVLLYGKPLEDKDHIPMVFQQYSSFPWYTVLENVSIPLKLKRVPKKEARERAMEMIKIVGLDGHENKFAKYPILSGGQLQRVAIARNLVANSKILLMDEPFGALDIVTRRQMQMFLRKIFQDNNQIDPTIILVTHDIREAIFLATDIFILDAFPANVRCHIEVDLPDVRDLSIKREPKFLEYVNYVEDFMGMIESENDKKPRREKVVKKRSWLDNMMFNKN